MYPRFDDRCSNIYGALYYSKDASGQNPLTDAVFASSLPMAADDQRSTFSEILRGAVCDECSYELVQTVRDHLSDVIETYENDKFADEPPAVTKTELCDLLPKATIINGDGTDQDLLLDEGLADSDAFVALSSLDEENIIMSLFAKTNSNSKIVTKINRETYADIARKLGIETIISPKQLANGLILSYVRSLENASSESRIESLYNIIGNRVEAIEFNVTEKIPDLTSIPLKDLKIKKNILICAIIRKRQAIIPNGQDKIEAGDSVIIITKEHRFSELRDILE